MVTASECACGAAGSALAAGAGFSHLHFPPATICAADFVVCGFAAGFGSGGCSQQLVTAFDSSSASQQLVFLGFGASGGGFGSEQQHAAAACSTGEHAHEAEPVAAQAARGVRFATAATGNASTGVNWPMRARTASASRR